MPAKPTLLKIASITWAASLSAVLIASTTGSLNGRKAIEVSANPKAPTQPNPQANETSSKSIAASNAFRFSCASHFEGLTVVYSDSSTSPAPFVEPPKVGPGYKLNTSLAPEFSLAADICTGHISIPFVSSPPPATQPSVPANDNILLPLDK